MAAAMAAAGAAAALEPRAPPPAAAALAAAPERRPLQPRPRVGCRRRAALAPRAGRKLPGEREDLLDKRPDDGLGGVSGGSAGGVAADEQSALSAMELRFGRLLGEAPQRTMSKVMRKRADPAASFVELDRTQQQEAEAAAAGNGRRGPAASAAEMKRDFARLLAEETAKANGARSSSTRSKPTAGSHDDDHDGADGSMPRLASRPSRPAGHSTDTAAPRSGRPRLAPVAAPRSPIALARLAAPQPPARRPSPLASFEGALPPERADDDDVIVAPVSVPRRLVAADDGGGSRSSSSRGAVPSALLDRSIRRPQAMHSSAEPEPPAALKEQPAGPAAVFEAAVVPAIAEAPTVGPSAEERSGKVLLAVPPKHQASGDRGDEDAAGAPRATVPAALPQRRLPELASRPVPVNKAHDAVTSAAVAPTEAQDVTLVPPEKEAQHKPAVGSGDGSHAGRPSVLPPSKATGPSASSSSIVQATEPPAAARTTEEVTSGAELPSMELLVEPAAAIGSAARSAPGKGLAEAPVTEPSLAQAGVQAPQQDLTGWSAEAQAAAERGKAARLREERERFAARLPQAKDLQHRLDATAAPIATARAAEPSIAAGSATAAGAAQRLLRRPSQRPPVGQEPQARGPVALEATTADDLRATRPPLPKPRIVPAVRNVRESNEVGPQPSAAAASRGGSAGNSRPLMSQSRPGSRPSLRNEKGDKEADARDWARAEALLASGVVEEAEVVGCNSGGLLVSFGSLIAFLPSSELAASKRLPSLERWGRLKGLDMAWAVQPMSDQGAAASAGPQNVEAAADAAQHEAVPVERQEELRREYKEERLKHLSSHVGQKVKLKVKTVNRQRRQLIISEKATESETGESLQKKQEVLAGLKEGDTVSCRVTVITQYGVFVEEIEAMVCKLDFQASRINLSLKQLQPDPLMETLESLVGLPSETAEWFSKSLEPSASAQAEPLPEVSSVIRKLQEQPAILSVALGRSLRASLQVYLSEQLDNGFKLLARSGQQVQEILVQTLLNKEQMKAAIKEAMYSDA
eukprot:SM000011S19006  [mRNA]  locus=s11:303231:309468:+ [translate_table: standard]